MPGALTNGVLRRHVCVAFFSLALLHTPPRAALCLLPHVHTIPTRASVTDFIADGLTLNNAADTCLKVRYFSAPQLSTSTTVMRVLPLKSTNTVEQGGSPSECAGFERKGWEKHDSDGFRRCEFDLSVYVWAIVILVVRKC